MNDVALTARQVRYTNRAFWRNPQAAFFTFAFPLMFLVIFTALLGSGEVEVAPGVTILGTGSHTSVSSGRGLVPCSPAVGCCAKNGALTANKAADARNLENGKRIILDEHTHSRFRPGDLVGSFTVLNQFTGRRSKSTAVRAAWVAVCALYDQLAARII